MESLTLPPRALSASWSEEHVLVSSGGESEREDVSLSSISTSLLFSLMVGDRTGFPEDNRFTGEGLRCLVSSLGVLTKGQSFRQRVGRSSADTEPWSSIRLKRRKLHIFPTTKFKSILIRHSYCILERMCTTYRGTCYQTATNFWCFRRRFRTFSKR